MSIDSPSTNTPLSYKQGMHAHIDIKIFILDIFVIELHIPNQVNAACSKSLRVVVYLPVSGTNNPLTLYLGINKGMPKLALK
jgi:hypothetical protein